MGTRKQVSIDLELDSLIKLGWNDIDSNESGLRIVEEVSESAISYPAESYKTLHTSVDSVGGLWASWRAKEIARLIEHEGIDVLWEVGSGKGSVALSLLSMDICVIGIEPLIDAAKYTAENGLRTYVGTLESLKLPSNSISAIGIFDVLEHLENPKIILEEIHRILKPEGSLLISVPAHQWLFSDFDTSIGHFRRYSMKSLSALLSICGFGQIRNNYLFSIFVLPAFIIRKIPTIFGRNSRSSETIRKNRNQSRILEVLKPLLNRILHFEKFLRLPFGLSILSVSKKSLST